MTGDFCCCGCTLSWVVTVLLLSWFCYFLLSDPDDMCISRCLCLHLPPHTLASHCDVSAIMCKQWWKYSVSWNLSRIFLVSVLWHWGTVIFMYWGLLIHFRPFFHIKVCFLIYLPCTMFSIIVVISQDTFVCDQYSKCTYGSLTLPETETETETDKKMGSIVMCRTVHTTQRPRQRPRQRPMPLGPVPNFSVSV